MKKILVITLVMVMVMGMSNAAFANGNNQPAKTFSVDVSLTGVEEVEVGDTVIFNASTVKQGQLDIANWSGIGVTGGATTLNAETDTYDSSASFFAGAVGTYEIEYYIRMVAGKSHVEFVGLNGATVQVIDDKTVVVQKVTVKVVKKTVPVELKDSTTLSMLAEIELSNGETLVREFDQVINWNQNQRNVVNNIVDEEFGIEYEIKFDLQKDAVVDSIVYTFELLEE